MAVPAARELHQLSQAQYAEVERLLKRWKQEVLELAKRHPSKGYELGREQARQFARITGAGRDPLFGGPARSKLFAVRWLRRYTLHELEGSLDEFIDEVRSAVLYGQGTGVNPLQVASWLYHASGKVQINWRMIARTEMVRANNAGRLDACQEMGYDQVWVPPHIGACEACKELIENKVFTIDELRNATNYKRRRRDYVPCIPLHPMCRHVAVPYIKAVYDRAQEQYKLLPSEADLKEWFESSGQLKPEYQRNPPAALEAYIDQLDKVHDPYAVALAKATETTDVHKGYFDNPQQDLDPLVWRHGKLLTEVRDRLVAWWTHTLGPDPQSWSRPYIGGSITSLAYAGKRAPGDLDIQIVVDYPALRKARPEYAALSDPELHAALVTQVNAGLDGVEVAPGLMVDAYIRPEQTPERFQQDVRNARQPVWDILAHNWLIPPVELPVSADVVNQDILEGLGGQLAVEHPDWVSIGVRLAQQMTTALDRYRDGDEHAHAELQAAYTMLHELRKREFTGGVGNDGLGQWLWQYLTNYGPLPIVKHLLHVTSLGKVMPGYTLDETAADGWVRKSDLAAGTEHWITVHPNGPDEKGIPVLIRENGDGTARVIGGAGGHLDFLRISTKGRMKPKVGQTEPKMPVGEVTEEMADAARTSKQQAQDALRELKNRVRDHVQGIVDSRGAMVAGQAVGWADLSHREQEELVKRATHDALYQSTYGQMHDLKRADAPPGPIIVTPAPKDTPAEDLPETAPVEDADQTSSPEEQDVTPPDETGPQEPPARKIKLPLSTEEADAIWEDLASATVLRRRIREANKVLAGEKTPTDAAALDWQPIDAPAEAQRKAAFAAQSDVNRGILDMVDTEASAGRTGRFNYALKKGAFDAFDSLSYSVMGRGILPPRLQELLGVQGTAQLLANQLQQHEGFDTDTLKKVIDEVTDDRQTAVTNIDLHRAQYAAREAAAAMEERQQAYAGEGIATITYANVRISKKLKEAAYTLGMSIAGSEALHSLRAIIDQPVHNVRVEGYGSRAQIMELAKRADVHITAKDIERVGPSNYALNVPAERMQSLLDGFEPPNELKDYLGKIRTGEGMDAAIEEARRPPGYSRVLDRAQAQGSMFLRATKSGILAFAPGVGKTDTAVGAALQLMHDKPGTRVLIVAPATALAGAWAKTIQQAAPGKSLNIYGKTQSDEPGFEWGKDKPKGMGRQAKEAALQAETAADFTVIGYDMLKKMPPGALDKLGHSIVIADEAQMTKNEKSQRFEGLDAVGQTEGVTHRWALTGTPVEKNLGEMYTVLNWARPDAYGSRSGFNERFKNLNQYDELTSEEKLAQFREALGDGVFFQSQNMSDMPPFPELNWNDTPLAEGHLGALKRIAADYNQQWKDRHYDRTVSKLPPQEARKIGYNIGGYTAMMGALLKPQQHGYEGANTRITKMADMVEAAKPVDFKGFKGHPAYGDGDHAGTYQPKSIVFGRETQPLAPLVDELKRRGIKVIYTDGSMSDNDQRLAQFLKEKGRCVLVTSDTNKTARSLQFGDNGGKPGRPAFQHGATQMIHADLPQNNADLQQRIARIWRRGSQVPVSNDILYSNTPFERSMRDTLANELKTQRAVGNPEDKVTSIDEQGKAVQRETIRQKLKRHGQDTLVAPPVQHGRQAQAARRKAKETEKTRRSLPAVAKAAVGALVANARSRGSSFELRGNTANDGYQVPLVGHAVTVALTASDEELADAILRYHDEHLAAIEKPNVALAVELDGDQLHFGPVEHVTDEGHARMLAGQRGTSVWDAANDRDLDDDDN